MSKDACKGSARMTCWPYGKTHCSNDAVRDGYCGTHHPDAVAKRKAKQQRNWDEKDANMKARDDAAALQAPMADACGVERVARAMCQADDDYQPVGYQPGFNILWKEDAEKYRAMAKAAIAAMQQPVPPFTQQQLEMAMLQMAQNCLQKDGTYTFHTKIEKAGAAVTMGEKILQATPPTDTADLERWKARAIAAENGHPHVKALVECIRRMDEALDIARGYIAIQAFTGNSLLQKMLDDKIEPALSLAKPHLTDGEGK